MGRIYRNQTMLTITIDLKTNLSFVDTALIKYKKPDSTTGSFIASIGSTTISYDIQNAADIDQVGTWQVWPHLTDGTGKIIVGTASQMRVYREGV